MESKLLCRFLWWCPFRNCEEIHRGSENPHYITYLKEGVLWVERIKEKSVAKIKEFVIIIWIKFVK